MTLMVKIRFNLTLTGKRRSETDDLCQTLEFKRRPTEQRIRQVLPKRILDLGDVVCWYHSDFKTGCVFAGHRCLGGFEVLRS